MIQDGTAVAGEGICHTRDLHVASPKIIAADIDMRQ